MKFPSVIDFVRSLTEIVSIILNTYPVTMSGYKADFPYNYDNASAGKTPGYFIIYPKMLTNRGDFPYANDPKATASGDSAFFTQEDNSGTATNADAIIVAYCPELKLYLFSNTAVRTSGATTLDIKRFGGTTVQTWLAFFSNQTKES